VRPDLRALPGHDGPEPPTPEESARASAAGAWVTLLGRTLKTARLYGSDNPTVDRMRSDLSGALTDMLERHGAVALEFTSDDVRCHGQSLHPARSRDDNLAAVFYRDGVHGVTLHPGFAADELNALVALTGRVARFQADDEDLVTLLWEANLPHLEFQSVAVDADVDAGDFETVDGAGSSLPWPGPSPTSETSPFAPGAAERADARGRSDDHLTDDTAGPLEAIWRDLTQRAPVLLQGFRTLHAADAAEDVVLAGLAVLDECLALATGPEDRTEILAFVPRVLREAIGRGAWESAIRALTMLQEGDPEAIETLFAELGDSDSLTSGNAVKALDEQDASQLQHFLRFTRATGEPAGSWLMRVVADSRQQRVRRALVAELATLWNGQPECLEAWLADERWYVARNAAHILGLMATDATIPLLAVAATHPEFRVRREVIDALGRLDPTRARPLLFGMLENADTRTFCAALRQLASAPGPRLASVVSAHVAESSFVDRPAEEQRAVFSALAACGDSALPVLVGELNRGGVWNSNHTHRQAVARCIARIGTAAAIAALNEGARSRNASVRRACGDALGPGAIAA